MGSLTDFAINYILPILSRIAPHWTEALKVNLAVGAEKGRRPHPFSLWTGMETGTPRDGSTAPTAKPLLPNAPATGRKTRKLRTASAPNSADPAPQAAAFAPSGYVSWPGLADRRYTGRHLPPADQSFVDSLPPIEETVRTLFSRAPGSFVASTNTSALFCFFAQWFTDSFLRTDPLDRRRNTSNHEIDFCQIYGLDERTTFALREHAGGRMRLQGGLLPRLTDDLGAIRPEFLDISYVRDDAPDSNNVPIGQRLRNALGRSLPQASQLDRWSRMYASGLERGNSTILYTALS